MKAEDGILVENYIIIVYEFVHTGIVVYHRSIQEIKPQSNEKRSGSNSYLIDVDFNDLFHRNR